MLPQSVQNDSQALAEVLNQLKDMLANFRGSEKYCYLQNEVFGLFQKLENINGVTDGYLNRCGHSPCPGLMDSAALSQLCLPCLLLFPFFIPLHGLSRCGREAGKGRAGGDHLPSSL